MNSSKIAVGLAFILVALINPAYADTLINDPNQTILEDILKDCNLQLNDWRRLWLIEVGLAFLVLVLGAVSAAIQNFSLQSVKIITIVCGLVITVTTGFVNLIGWDNYTTLGSTIDKAKSIVHNMDRARRDYALVKESDKAVPLNEFRDLYKNFKKIQEPSPDKITKSGNFGLGIINAAYAMDPLPSWVRTVPDDPRNLYFVGVADSAKLEDAKVTSKDNAIQNAMTFFVGTLNAVNDKQLNNDKLALTLIKSSEEAENYTSLNEKNGTYRYYSLIRINKSLAESAARFFAAEQGINAPASTIKAIGDSRRMRDDYSATQLEKYEVLLDKTSTLLSADEYSKFSEARELRRSKKSYEESIVIFKEILEMKPEFYMGWYNIALAYSALGNDADARISYDKAIALESAQPMRDGTIYNAYGNFLLERKHYCEAIPLFELALGVDERNPRAQNNLVQAKNQLQMEGKACQ